jgi:UDP-N-acetyl-D-glucosamine/UDP-N-acetyl-D-galactosamine dehydrogenase
MQSVTVLGLTFKENVPDIRNSKVADIIHELRAFGAEVQVHDALASPKDARREYDIKLSEYGQLQPVEAVILAVPHDCYVRSRWPFIVSLLKDSRGLIIDVKSKLDRDKTPPGVELWRL